MARKSRKNMMPQAAVQEAVQQNEKELLRTAAYARLSVENGGHETEDSLHTLILQIHNYIRENPELTLTDTYADNGFTGTRFDRPEFERMMQDIRTGKIQCIVVKDLSRFGRDYIETGSYLETIFPMLHVRFIAIKTWAFDSGFDYANMFSCHVKLLSKGLLRDTSLFSGI